MHRGNGFFVRKGHNSHNVENVFLTNRLTAAA